jgi:hypothetical protein
MKNILIAFSVWALLLTSLSCNDSSILGADLFEGEKLNLTFTDTLSINAVSETTDSVLVYVPSSYYFDSIPFGKVNDPTFGLTESRIYTQLRFDTSVLSSLPLFKDKLSLSAVILDSVFLDLVYGPTRIYGDTLAPQTLGVYHMTEAIPTENIYSNRKLFSSETTPIGKHSFSPKPYSNIISIRKKDTTTLSPRIRIPLSSSFGRQFLDTNNLKKGNDWLNGLEIRPEATTNTMLSFNFGSSITNPSALRVYYRTGTDTLSLILPLNTAHFANFKHGYASAPIKEFVNNQRKSDSLLFIQSMSGANVKIEFPYLTNLGKVAINKAELELTVVKDSKTDIFPAIDQLVVKTAQFSPITDLGFDSNYGNGSTRPLETMSTSGGYVRTELVKETGETVQKYYFNLSGNLQQMLEGKRGSTLYITPHFKEEKGSRVVLYGPKTSKYRAKLNLHYTKIK